MHQQAQAVFLAIMGCVETHARIYFRYIKCPHKREDLVQECLCIAYKWTLSMVRRDKDPREFPTAVASKVALHVRCGRKFVGGKSGKNDVLSHLGQARHGFDVHPLPSPRVPHENIYGTVKGQQDLDVAEEILQEHDRSPVPDQAAFRIDFGEWRLLYDEHRREIMDDMMTGEQTKALAAKFKVSSGRISQMRREFEAGWKSFHADNEE